MKVSEVDLEHENGSINSYLLDALIRDCCQKLSLCPVCKEREEKRAHKQKLPSSNINSLVILYTLI